MAFLKSVFNVKKINKSLVKFLCYKRLFDAKSCTGRNISCAVFIHGRVLSTHSPCLKTEFLSQLFKTFLIFTFSGNNGEFS